MKQNATAGILTILARGGVGVMATDTIYGIVGSALKPGTVERIYRLRKRSRAKPFIVLIASRRDLARFGVRPDRKTKKILCKLWPGPVSVILPCALKRFAYLHRGAETIAFRVPAKQSLRRLLAQTGPLVAPSANPEGMPPANTIAQAKQYFGNRVDFYVDGGSARSLPSTLIAIKDGTIHILRKGARKI